MPLINFSGIASGIDTEGLIDATSGVTRQVRIQPKEDKISEIQDENSALEELKSRLTTLQSLATGFSTLTGGILTKQGSSDDETVVTATASTTASNGSYSLAVSQLAKNATVSLGSSVQTYTNADAVLNSGAPVAPGADVPITIGILGGAETVNVNVDNTTTLSEWVAEFNSKASLASASVVNVGNEINPDFKILVTSNNTGLRLGNLTANNATIPDSIDTGPTAAFDEITTSQALNANFTMAGIPDTIVRDTNVVSDLIDGVTFNLESTGAATVTVEVDNAATLAKAQEYVDNYNEVVQFITDNDAVIREEDGEDIDNIFGPLAKTRLDNNVLASIKSDMSNASLDPNSGLEFTLFGAIGITTERDGTLKLDEDNFESALDAEPDSVNDLFLNLGDTAGRAGGTIDQFIRFNGLFDTVINSNEQQVSDLNDEISRSEALIARTEESMRARFARLESLIGNLQNQQSSLASILSGLG